MSFRASMERVGLTQVLPKPPAALHSHRRGALSTSRQRRAIVSYRHLRILATVAHHSQRQFDDHDAVAATATAASSARRHDRKLRATRTSARVAAARARRRHGHA